MVLLWSTLLWVMVATAEGQVAFINEQPRLPTEPTETTHTNNCLASNGREGICLEFRSKEFGECLFFPSIDTSNPPVANHLTNNLCRTDGRNAYFCCPHIKEDSQDIVSYHQHGFHPANAESMKLQCVWNRKTTFIPKDLSPNINHNEDCMIGALANCGVDYNDNGLNCNATLEYRSIDGTCNNLNHTRWGSAPQPFERFLGPDYGVANGELTGLRRSATGEELPEPRRISRALSSSTQGKQPNVTLMLMQWGQFLDHDITLTPERETGRQERDEYTKPLDKTWNCTQCSEAGRFEGRTLGGCIIECDSTPGCNAFNYKEDPNSDCVLFACDVPIPEPKVNNPPHKGYKRKDPGERSSTLKCCDKGKKENSVSLHKDCIPINVKEDPFYRGDGIECLRFVRSMPAPSKCISGSRMEQINQNTAFVDGSMVYGSEAEVAAIVRRGRRGLLSTTNGLPPKGGKNFAHQCPIPEARDRCFLAGDIRVDEIPGLTAMHTAFIGLHNRIANGLCGINRHWCSDDEKLFQETRRIVIALIQQITYRDWLPHVVGQTLMNKYNLNTKAEGYSSSYSHNIKPTIRNAFSGAAFRFGHSLIAEVIKTATVNHPVPGNFFNINLIENDDTSPSSLLKGLARCPSQPMDAKVEPAFTNSLFSDHPAGNGIYYGLDLLSINIQRGRDHGIPGYIKWRSFCGLENITISNPLNKVMPNKIASEFRSIYRGKLEDIDLFPAGLAENPIADGILGPTFACIIARQFDFIKRGDRFWYERKAQPKRFTKGQLTSIRSQTLTKILCIVSDQTPFGLQPNIFLVETAKGNHVQTCSPGDFIDLRPWIELIEDPKA